MWSQREPDENRKESSTSDIENGTALKQPFTLPLVPIGKCSLALPKTPSYMFPFFDLTLSQQ